MDTKGVTKHRTGRTRNIGIPSRTILTWGELVTGTNWQWGELTVILYCIMFFVGYGITG